MSAYLEAILLGIVQGIAEFLPISSSGHLVIAGELLSRATGHDLDPEGNLHRNVALHAGTLGSILWVYRREVRELFRVRRLVPIIVATLPLVVLALVLSDDLESAFEQPLVAGVCLLVTAALLAATPRIPQGNVELDRVGPGRAGIIGLLQAFAVLPGISRSGTTIVAGLATGLERRAATTFSFLIAIPAILGATLLTVVKIVTHPSTPTEVGPLCVGAFVAFVVGVVSLRGLVRIVAAGRLHWFAAYCAAVGIGTIVWQLVEGR